ncbi:RAD59 [Candida margitis]|uniref:RAD59 n=1 Tax=Candida margitis TaxID=1775924 RepID=UPI002226E77F|nr:RAD59 [Candida margitis]KAI5970525.1 RAD59 [Candida margitis]
MPFEDSKYEINEETRNLPSTVSYFPTIADLEDQATSDSVEEYDDSVLKKISLLQIKLEQLQYSRDSKNIGGLNWNFNKFSGHTLYALANEVFGFNGWSTSIEECIISETNVSRGQGGEEEANGESIDNASIQSASTSERSTPNVFNDAIVNCEETSKDNGLRYSAKCICVVRLTLEEGTCTEGIGEGTATNLPHRYMCYSKCKKEAVTDGIKNAIIGLRGLYFRYESKKVSEELCIPLTH